VVVLYDGRVLEDSPVAVTFTQPTHAYTAALLAASPRYDQPEKSIEPVPKSLISQLSAQTLALDSATHD